MKAALKLFIEKKRVVFCSNFEYLLLKEETTKGWFPTEIVNHLINTGQKVLFKLSNKPGRFYQAI